MRAKLDESWKQERTPKWKGFKGKRQEVVLGHKPLFGVNSGRIFPNKSVERNAAIYYYFSTGPTRITSVRQLFAAGTLPLLLI
jgi:hypothetical protein